MVRISKRAELIKTMKKEFTTSLSQQEKTVHRKPYA
jgi:hypothetical protein